MKHLIIGLAVLVGLTFVGMSTPAYAQSCGGGYNGGYIYVQPVPQNNGCSPYQYQQPYNNGYGNQYNYQYQQPYNYGYGSQYNYQYQRPNYNNGYGSPYNYQYQRPNYNNGYGSPYNYQYQRPCNNGPRIQIHLGGHHHRRH